MTEDNHEADLAALRMNHEAMARAVGLPETVDSADLYAAAWYIGAALQNVNAKERKSLITQMRNHARGMRQVGMEVQALALEITAAGLENVNGKGEALRQMVLARLTTDGSTH